MFDREKLDSLRDDLHHNFFKFYSKNKFDVNINDYFNKHLNKIKLFESINPIYYKYFISTIIVNYLNDGNRGNIKQIILFMDKDNFSNVFDNTIKKLSFDDRMFLFDLSVDTLDLESNKSLLGEFSYSFLSYLFTEDVDLFNKALSKVFISERRLYDYFNLLTNTYFVINSFTEEKYVDYLGKILNKAQKENAYELFKTYFNGIAPILDEKENTMNSFFLYIIKNGFINQETINHILKNLLLITLYEVEENLEKIPYEFIKNVDYVDSFFKFNLTDMDYIDSFDIREYNKYTKIISSYATQGCFSIKDKDSITSNENVKENDELLELIEKNIFDVLDKHEKIKKIKLKV